MSKSPARASAARPVSREELLGRPAAGWRQRLFDVVFRSDSASGRLFDLVVIGAILASCAVVIVDSVPRFHARLAGVLGPLEWAITLAFTLEYLMRIACVQRPWRYIFSFYGLIDLLALIPTYLSFVIPGAHALIDVRLLRLLRIFRILKLGAYAEEFNALGEALRASRRKISVFLGFVGLVVVVMGTLMYVVEGPGSGFTSIPTGIYWAITTLTTVGFGDIAPKTPLGRAIASVMMLLGWGTLAVPTGIVSAEFTSRRVGGGGNSRRCPVCSAGGHGAEARYCHACGAALGDGTGD